MRRNLITEEETPVRFSAPPQSQEQEEKKVEPARATAAPKTASTARPAKRARNASPSSGAMRAGIVLFSSLGLFALIVPTVTGVPLNEWLQGANFKAAYSGANLSYMRGSAALKMGNLGGATDAVLALPPQSTEAEDLAVPTFLQLLQNGDYPRAIAISKHMLPEAVLTAMAFPQPASTEHTNMLAQYRISSTVSLSAIGSHLVESMGPEKALAYIEKTPELNAVRELLIPTIFSSATSNLGVKAAQDPTSKTVADNIAALEKVVPTLSSQGQLRAMNSMVTMNLNAHQYEAAWQWTLKLPEKEGISQQGAMMSRIATEKPELALQLVSGLGSGMERDHMRQQAVWGIAQKFPQEARGLVETIKTPQLRDMALKDLANAPGITDRIALLNQITTPHLKLEALISLVNTPTTTPETLQQILPRFTELARKNPTLISRHDDALKSLAARTQERAKQEAYLNLMLNPTEKAAAQQLLKDGKLLPTVGGIGGGAAPVVPSTR